MAESTSKLRAQVKALTNVNGSGGVDILADEKTFRSTYDIMSDIADVWSGMSDIDQSALLELLAGKVRSNQVAALLSNFDQAEAALKTSQNAEGTMDKVHRAWMDSVEARKAQFEAAQETLSMTVMPANTLKGLYQTGTSALGLLNTVIGATSPVGFGAGVFGVANALRSGGGSIAAGLGNITGYHRDMFNGGKLTRGDLGFVNAYNAAFSQTGDKQAAFNKAISQSNKQLDSYTMSLYSNTSGLIDVSKVTKSFGSQIASFAKNAAVGLATFGAMELAAVGLNAAWQWFNSDILHRGETLANNAATAHAEAEQASQAADARREELQTVQEQIQGMEQKRQTSGGLTSAEEAELMELRSQQRVAQYRQDIAEAQEKSKSATAVAERTKSYEWDRATQTTLGAALPGATSGVNALDAFEAALVTARDRLKTLNKGSQEYLDTKEDVKTLSAWNRQLTFRMAASKAGSVEGQALLARYGQAQDLDLAGRYQSKVNDRVAKLDGSYADLQARSDTLAELFDFINNTDNLSPEALGEAYKFASQEYNSLMDAINKREGAAAELGKDENAAFSQLYQKSASTDAKLADTLDKMETDAQSWLGDYFRAGEQVSDVQGAAMRDYIGSYLGLREAMQPGQKLDAVRSLLAGTPLAEALMALDELAAKGQLTADSIEGLKVDNVEDAGQRVAAALALFGINLTQAADMWNAARDESRQPSGGNNPPAATVNAYGDRKTSVAGVFAAQDTGEKLWSSSGFSGTMTMDDYEKMMALDDGAYQAAIQYANGGLFFNKDVFDKLVQQKYREELNGLRKDVADTQKKYAEAAQRLTDLADKKRSGGANLDDDAINAAISAANDDLQTAAKELAGYRAMQAMIQNGMTDYANWLRNKSGPESGDMYDELGVAAQAILSGKKSGKVGTRQFEAAMRLYTGQENFDVNNLSKKDWSTLRGLSGVDSTGKAVEGLAEKTLFGIRNELQSMGILGKNFEILDKNMTAERMSELYNKQYGANTNSEFMTGLFMALNDYIQNPANKYQIGATETPEDVAMQDAAREFAKIAKDFKDGKATAEDLLAAAGKLDEATNTALQTTGTEDAQKQAGEMVDAKTQADTLASIDKSLSNLVDINQQQLDVQTGKKSTTEDDNAGGGQGGAAAESKARYDAMMAQKAAENQEWLKRQEDLKGDTTGSKTDEMIALKRREAEEERQANAIANAKNQLNDYAASKEVALAAEAGGEEGRNAINNAFADMQKAIDSGDLDAFNNELGKLTSQIHAINQRATEEAQNAAQQAAEAQAKEDQRNRLLEAATPDAVAAIEDQQSQATARDKAETAARKALEEEAAAAENALRETNAQRYGEAYDKAMTSPDIDHGGPGQKALEQAFKQIGAAFEAGDWEAFESAMQNLDQVTAAVAAADQERREREQQESDDRAAGKALQARLEEQKQNAEQPTVSTDLDKPLTEETAVSAAEEATATLAELAQADQERVAAEQEQSNLLAQNVQGQEDLTEAVQDNQPPEQPAVSTDFNTPLTEETGVSAAEAKAMEQALLAQEEAARQQMESAQKQRAKDAADLDRQEREERAKSDAAAGQALEDRREEQRKAQQEQHDRLLEEAMPDAVSAIEDQNDQARKRQEAENEARRALAEEAAKASQQPTVSTDFDTPLTAETGVSAAEAQAMEQALLAQTEAVHQQLEGTQELSEAVQDNTEQVAENTAQATQAAEQQAAELAAAEAERAQYMEDFNADIAAGQAYVMTDDEIDALYDRGDAVVDEIQDFVNSNLDGNEQLSAAGMELNNALRGLSSEVSPEQLAGMIDNAQKMLDEARGVVESQEQGGATAGQEKAQPELADNVALQAGSVTMPDLSQVSANGNVDLNARPIISGQQMLAAGWQEFAENLGDYATLFSSTSTGGGMTSLATPIGANGTVYSPNDFFNYLDWLHGTSSSAADMINRDNPNNGGLGLLISAIDGESEETIQAMDQLGQQLSQSQAEMYGQAGDVDLQADNVNVGTTPDNLPQPAAGAQEPTQQAKEPVDTTSSASVEPEIPSTNKEVSVDTKSATISLPSGSLGISSELRSQGQSALFGLEDSSYAMGMRPGGEALSPAEVQAVNNAINSLSQALTGDDAQALTAAMGTATQIMQGNISVSPSATEAVQSGSGSGSGGGGGQAPVTQATVQVTAETPEIPTPEAPSVTIPVTAEEADIPTPAVPSVVIPVSYGDPGSLSVEQPAGVTIPVAWGDPGPAPGGGGGVTLSAPMAAASGTDNARGGTTLVDELGAELIEHRSRGTYELGTDRGARFTKLDPGDIVHNAKETSKILQRGKAMWRGGVETGRAAAASLAPDYSGKTRYTFTADNITVNAKNSTPGTSMQGGNMSSSAGDKLYKWLTSPEHAMQQAMEEHSRIQHGPPANIDKETGERIGKEFLEWLKKLIDWIPTYLSVLKKKTTAFINATDDAIHYLSKNQLLDDAIGNVAEEIKANMQAVMRYQDFLNEMAGKGFSQDIIDKIQNGTIDIKEYGDEDTVKSIQAYQEYWNKLVACREALQSLNAQMEALSAQKLEHVVDYFDRIDSLLRDQQKTFESLLSMKKQYGEELKVTDYVDSLQTMEQVLANAQNEETALIQELKDQLGVDGDLVNAILKGGREVWDTIAEHVKKNTYSIVEDVKPEVQAAYAESRKNAKEEEETSKKQASTFTINGTTYYKTSSGKYRSMTNGSYITASAAKQAIQTQQEAVEETKPEDLDFSITDVPVTPITDEEIIELGEKLGMVMTDGSEEALANFETIKSLLTTSWEHPLAIGSDTWYEYMSTLERLRESIYSTKTEIGELKDEMADIPLTNLKTGFDYLEEIQRNLEDMNSLLDAQGSAKYEDTYRSLISVGMKQIENLQEQNKLIQEQMNGLDPLSEKYQELRSNLNGNLDTIADIRKSQEEWNDEIIDLQIERLRKQNDSYKEQLRLMEALDDLDKARQRRLLIYHEDTGFQYEADEDELESAQEAANDAIFNNIISDLEKSKADSNIYGPLGERLISGSSILDSLGNVLVPVEDKLSGLDFEPYYQSIVSGSEQSGLLEGLLQSIDLSKLLEASIGGNVNIDIGTMTLNEVQNAKDLGDAIINQLPSYLLQALYKKGAN